jgi:hypothetical protein
MSKTYTTKPIKMTTEHYRKIMEESEGHHVPFGGMVVNAFHQGALIREASARYYEPSFRDQIQWDAFGERIENPRGTNLWPILMDVVPQGLLGVYHREDEFDFDIRVNMAVGYPLHDIHAIEVSLKASRFGDVFGVAHDLYKGIYDLDDAAWTDEGEADAPRAAPKMLNRARGKYVWGHDMSDLVFEAMYFSMHPDWPVTERVSRWHVESDISKEDLEAAYAKVKGIDPAPPKVEKKRIPMPQSLAPSDKDACPLLGTITFAIGS